MEIKSQFDYCGKIYKAHWVEKDPTLDLDKNNVLRGVHAICFYKNKIVVVYEKKKNCWTPPGGGIEQNETYQEAVIREVKEESNMKVLHQEYIGYQDVTNLVGKTTRQVRSFCIVEPYGDFVSDPDGDITKIKLIDPKDYKKYFDWLEIGDRIMELAIELNNKYKMED